MRPRLSATIRRAAGALLTVSLLAVPAATPAGAAQGFYQQHNLVSDMSGQADNTDSHLVNAWGLVHGPTTPWWVSDNGAGVSTLYNGSGTPFPPGSPLVVQIPTPGHPMTATGTPTGVVFNISGSGFTVCEDSRCGPSRFMFSTEDGTIAGWSPSVDFTHAVLAAVSAGAVYKGLAIGTTASGTFLYATNFRAGTVDVFNSSFARATLSGSFSDPGIKAGFAPFGIANLGGLLYVTYAKQDAALHDDVAGPANGFVDVFDTSGNLVRRAATRGRLNSPWGVAIAPSNFGQFSGDLLVGNFGDGRINVIDPATGEFLDQLRDVDNRAITIDGLWALAFGNDAAAGSSHVLFFTAGPGGEAHGLFGSLTAMS